MTSETYRDVQISYGRYLKKPVGDQLPLVANFMPASARLGNKFIISSSLGTCRQLIEAMQQPESNGQRQNRNLNFEFHPSALADILQANKEVFQARAIQQGQDARQAEGEFSTNLQLLRFFDSFRLSSRVLPEALSSTAFTVLEPMSSPTTARVLLRPNIRRPLDRKQAPRKGQSQYQS